MFTKCLGLELAEYNIRCNIVSPGSTETDMQWSLWADENGAEQVIKGSLETFKTGIPLKKLAQLRILRMPCSFWFQARQGILRCIIYA